MLNSWGRDWGSWRPHAPTIAEPVPGVALWRYEDWADTIMDGWVLRLGVGAAEAFELFDRRPGARLRRRRAGALDPGARHPRQLPAPRRRRLRRARRLRLDPATLDETLRLLKENADERPSPTSGVLLTFAGGLLGLQGGRRARRPLEAPGARGRLVPLHRALVRRLRRAGARHARRGLRARRWRAPAGRGRGSTGMIEERAHGIGRAFWRDIAAAADARRPRPRAAARPRPRRGRAPRARAGTSGCASSPSPRARSRWRRCCGAMHTPGLRRRGGTASSRCSKRSIWWRRR